MHAVESKNWGSSVKAGPSLVLKTGPSFFSLFFPICIVFFGILKTQLVSHCAKIVFFAKFWGCQT